MIALRLELCAFSARKEYQGFHQIRLIIAIIVWISFLKSSYFLLAKDMSRTASIILHVIRLESACQNAEDLMTRCEAEANRLLSFMNRNGFWYIEPHLYLYS